VTGGRTCKIKGAFCYRRHGRALASRTYWRFNLKLVRTCADRCCLSDCCSQWDVENPHEIGPILEKEIVVNWTGIVYCYNINDRQSFLDVQHWMRTVERCCDVFSLQHLPVISCYFYVSMHQIVHKGGLRVGRPAV
jgi:hypothetical protein